MQKRWILATLMSVLVLACTPAPQNVPPETSSAQDRPLADGELAGGTSPVGYLPQDVEDGLTWYFAGPANGIVPGVSGAQGLVSGCVAPGSAFLFDYERTRNGNESTPQGARGTLTAVSSQCTGGNFCATFAGNLEFHQGEEAVSTGPNYSLRVCQSDRERLMREWAAGKPREW